MEENKRDDLAQLYALRACLSTLSIECDRMQGESDRARKVRTKIEDNSAEIANYGSIVSTSKKTYKSAKHDYNKAKREYDKKSFPLLCWMIALLCFAAAAVYAYYLRRAATENLYLYDIAIGALGVGAAFSALKAAIINRKVKPIKKKMLKARELMSDSKLWIEESESGALAVKAQTRSLKDLGRELDASCESVLEISLPFAKAIREAIGEAFSATVSEANYAATDFMIYEIKTGAAKDISEALLAADAKRSVNALEEAAYASHEKIGTDIDADAIELSSEICAKLSVVEEKITEKIGAVIEKVDRSRIADLGGAKRVRAELLKFCAAEVMHATLSLLSARPCIDIAQCLRELDGDKK